MSDERSPTRRDRPAEVHIDFSDAKSERDVHERFVKSLRFPVFYGYNWDAFWDVLTGFDCFPPRIILTATAHLRAAVPRAHAQLQSCFDDCQREHPHIALTVIWQ